MPRALKRQPTPITPNMPPHRLCVYGEGGVGKTTLALTYPSPLVINTDSGLEGDAVADAVGEEWRPDEWKDLNDLYWWLKTEVEKKGYKTIVIDSLDSMCRIILREAQAQATRGRDANSLDDLLVAPELQDYGKVAIALDVFLSNLRVLSKDHGVHIVLTSAVRLPDREKGRPKRQPDVQDAVFNTVAYWANIYGEMVLVETNDGGKKNAKNEPIMVEHRILWTRGSDASRVGKTRFGALRPGVTDPTFAVLRKKIEDRAVAPVTASKKTTAAAGKAGK